MNRFLTKASLRRGIARSSYDRSHLLRIAAICTDVEIQLGHRLSWDSPILL